MTTVKAYFPLPLEDDVDDEPLEEEGDWQDAPEEPLLEEPLLDVPLFEEPLLDVPLPTTHALGGQLILHE